MPTIAEVEETIPEDLRDLVTVEMGDAPQGKYIIVRPKQYLHKNWQPVMDALNKKFGKLVEWVSLGKESHWRILISNAVTGSAADAARRIDNIIAQLMQLKNDLAGNTR